MASGGKAEPAEVCTGAMLEPGAGEVSMCPVLGGLMPWRRMCDPHGGS